MVLRYASGQTDKQTCWSQYFIHPSALYRLQGSNAPWFMCWCRLCKLFVCFLSLPSLLFSFLMLCFLLVISIPVYFLTYLSTSSRIDPFRFQAGVRRRRPNMALVFCVLILYCIFCYGCMFVFLCLFLFFSTKPRDWLGRMSPKWPILYRVECKTLTQSISQSYTHSEWSSQHAKYIGQRSFSSLHQHTCTHTRPGHHF